VVPSQFNLSESSNNGNALAESPNLSTRTQGAHRDVPPSPPFPNQEHQENQEYQAYQDDQEINLPPRTCLGSLGSPGWDRVEKAAQKCRLTFCGTQELSKKLFNYARRVKGIAPQATDAELIVVVERWMVHSSTHIGDFSRDEIASLFMERWTRVKKPVGELLAACMAKALTLPDSESRGFDGKIGLLVRLCVALQQHHGQGKTWFLSCTDAGEAIGRDWSTAADYLRTLVRKGVLEVVNPSRYVENLATEYLLKSDPLPTF
jgi:hypothetical protein